jgi:Gpi18-like mannosyltransferase
MKEIRYPLWVFVLSRAIFFLPAIISQYFLGIYRGSPQPGHLWYHGGTESRYYLVNLLQKWDAYWFLNVAREGYHWVGITHQDPRIITGQETNLSVFPLLPLLMKIFSFGVFDPAIIGVIICNLSFFLGLVFLFKYLKNYGDEAFAQRGILYFSLYPLAFIYSSIYSDSLFILFSVLTFYFLDKRYFVRAGICAMLLTASRLTGIVILPAILAWIWVDWKKQKKIFTGAWIALGLAPLGCLFFFLWIWHLTGKYDAYFVAQQGWNKIFAVPWKTEIAGYIQNGFDIYGTPPDYFFILPITFFTLWKIWKQPLPLAVFWGISLLVALCSTVQIGFPRYLGVLFPMFIPLAQLGENEWDHRFILFLFLAAGNFAVIGWVNWYFSF